MHKQHPELGSQTLHRVFAEHVTFTPIQVVCWQTSTFLLPFLLRLKGTTLFDHGKQSATQSHVFLNFSTFNSATFPIFCLHPLTKPALLESRKSLLPDCKQVPLGRNPDTNHARIFIGEPVVSGSGGPVFTRLLICLGVSLGWDEARRLVDSSGSLVSQTGYTMFKTAKCRQLSRKHFRKKHVETLKRGNSFSV